MTHLLRPTPERSPPDQGTRREYSGSHPELRSWSRHAEHLEKLMHHRINRDLLATSALWTGVLIPLLYFGNQFVAAAFYPGYSFLSQDASTLGSADSRWPELFNIGSVITGVLCGFTACGFLPALRLATPCPSGPRLGNLPGPDLQFGLGAASTAGLHPLPDPRHISGPLAIGGIGGFLLPFLIPAALWKLPDERWMKVLFAANFALLLTGSFSPYSARP